MDLFQSPVSKFMELVDRVRFSITTVESRFTLNGALFDHHDGNLHLVATDGHRLALAWAELPSEQSTKFLLPSSAIRNLPQLTSELMRSPSGRMTTTCFSGPEKRS